VRRTIALTATAYHEAGHAVAAHHEHMRFRSVTIRPGAGNLGHLAYRMPGWFQPDVEADARHRRLVERDARVSFAGPAAEARFKGRHNWRGASDDLDQAVSLLGYVCGSNGELEAYVRLIRMQAQGLMERHWDEVQAVAEALLERECLTAAEVAAVIDRVFDAGAHGRLALGDRL